MEREGRKVVDLGGAVVVVGWDFLGGLGFGGGESSESVSESSSVMLLGFRWWWLQGFGSESESEDLSEDAASREAYMLY